MGLFRIWGHRQFQCLSWPRSSRLKIRGTPRGVGIGVIVGSHFSWYVRVPYRCRCSLVPRSRTWLPMSKHRRATLLVPCCNYYLCLCIYVQKTCCDVLAKGRSPINVKSLKIVYLCILILSASSLARNFLVQIRENFEKQFKI